MGMASLRPLGFFFGPSPWVRQAVGLTTESEKKEQTSWRTNEVARPNVLYAVVPTWVFLLVVQNVSLIIWYVQESDLKILSSHHSQESSRTMRCRIWDGNLERELGLTLALSEEVSYAFHILIRTGRKEEGISRSCKI